MSATEHPRSVTDWLVVLSEDNWKICDKERLLAVAERGERKLSQMANGDRVWIYVNRKYVDQAGPPIQRFRAITRVTGPMRHLARSPWKSRGNSHFQNARPITVLHRLDAPAVYLLRQMSFAVEPPNWGIRLLSAPLRLSEADVQLLQSALPISLSQSRAASPRA